MKQYSSKSLLGSVLSSSRSMIQISRVKQSKYFHKVHLVLMLKSLQAPISRLVTKTFILNMCTELHQVMNRYSMSAAKSFAKHSLKERIATSLCTGLQVRVKLIPCKEIFISVSKRPVSNTSSMKLLRRSSRFLRKISLSKTAH